MLARILQYNITNVSLASIPKHHIQLAIALFDTIMEPRARVRRIARVTPRNLNKWGPHLGLWIFVLFIILYILTKVSPNETQDTEKNNAVSDMLANATSSKQPFSESFHSVDGTNEI